MSDQTAAQTVPVIDLSTEPGVGIGEWALVVLVAAVALAYLSRKFFLGRRKSGCASCGKPDCSVRDVTPN